MDVDVHEMEVQLEVELEVDEDDKGDGRTGIYGWGGTERVVLTNTTRRP